MTGVQTCALPIYNLAGPHEEGVSLDDFVDWLIDAGCKLERIEQYDQWLSRFETAMRALPEAQRQQSLLAILGPYKQPQRAVAKSLLSADKFQAASLAAGFAVPPLTQPVINKYLSDLRYLHLLK